MTLSLRDRAVIGDGTTTAFVTADGSIDWASFGSPDALPSLYSVLDPHGARVGITLNGLPSLEAGRQEYSSNGVPVVRSTFTAGEHAVEVADHVTRGVVVRLFTALRGRPVVGITVRAATIEGSFRRIERWSDGVAFGSVRVLGAMVDAPVALAAGEQAVVCLGVGQIESMRTSDACEAAETLARDWRSLLAEAAYDGPYRRAVDTSLMVLRLLTTGTGALLRAPTTSFPIRVKSERNFDERAAWLADNATAVRLFEELGLADWADRVRTFLAESSRRDLPLPPMLSWRGEPLGAERELLVPGWRETAPAHVNHYGAESLDLASMAEVAMVLDVRRHWPQIARIADFLSEHVLDPDHGRWCIRRRPLRHVASILGVFTGLQVCLSAGRTRDPLDLGVLPWADAIVVADRWLTTEGRFASPPAAGWRRSAQDDSSDAAVLRWASSTFPFTLPALREDGPQDDVARLAATVRQAHAQLAERPFMHRSAPGRAATS